MGLKKSKFTADNSVPSGSTFDFVSNGQNFKITSLIKYPCITNWA